MSTNQYVFNQYYFTFVKKIRQCAKKLKDKSSIARDVLKKIKIHYSTFDNKADQHINHFNTNLPKELFQSLIDADESNEWIVQNKDKELFKDLTLDSCSKMVKDNKIIIHQFILILHLFRHDELSNDDIKNIMERLKGIDDELSIPEQHKELINKIIQLNLKSQAGFNMKEIEDTSIGKLAKDIVEDLDLDKIKQSVKNNGDILSALGDPENGLGNLIGDVSTKMAKKIKNGEIKQEDLFKDALNMGSKLPMFGNSGTSTSSDGMGGMGGMPDISNMMKMMQGMMGGANLPKNADFSKVMKSSKFKNMEKQMKQKQRMKSKLAKNNTEETDEMSKAFENLDMNNTKETDEMTQAFEKLAMKQ